MLVNPQKTRVAQTRNAAYRIRCILQGVDISMMYGRFVGKFSIRVFFIRMSGDCSS
ncbi:protein of unknown function [Burkholderia multivorans]